MSRDSRNGNATSWFVVALLCAALLALGYFLRPANRTVDPNEPSKSRTSPQLQLPRTVQLARRKQQSLETYNGIISLEELLAFYRQHTKHIVNKDAYEKLDELMLSEVVQTLWKESSAIAKGNRIQHGEMYQVLQQHFAHDTLTNADVILFPADSNLRSIVSEPVSDFFRDTARHWKWIAEFGESITEADGKDYKELDAYAAEELSEFISVLAVGVVELATSKSKDAVIEAEEISNVFASYKKYAPDVVMPRPAESRFSEQKKKEILASLPNPMFEEITKQTGIQYIHKPDAENQDKRIKLAVPLGIAGGGVSASDFDADGKTDIYFAGNHGGVLYQNLGDAKFEDVSEAAGLPSKGESRAGYFVDYDNDGDQDLFITFVGTRNRLLQNDGQGKFLDVSDEVGFLDDAFISHEAVWFDMNNDGLLDVYVANFGNWLGGDSPTLGRINKNAPPNRLYRHELVEGKHRFVEIGEQLNLDDRGWTHCVGAYDIDQDGWQDLFSINDFGASFVYRNINGEKFQEVSRELHLDDIYNGMSFTLLDLNHDSNFSIYITQIMKLTHRQRYRRPNEETPIQFDIDKKDNLRILVDNRLFSKAFESSFRDDHQFLIEPADFGWAWDASGFDYENDSDLDLIVLNGTESATPNNQQIRNKAYISGRKYLTKFNFARNVSLIQQDGYFYDVSDRSPVSFFGNSRGTTFLDLDDDGDLDVVVSNYNNKQKIFRNNQNTSNNWIRFALTGTQSNRDGIGSVVEIKFGDQTRYGIVVSGSGFLSQKPYELHFGLGEATKLESATIKWPSGQVQELSDLEVNKLHEVVEP